MVKNILYRYINIYNIYRTRNRYFKSLNSCIEIILFLIISCLAINIFYNTDISSIVIFFSSIGVWFTSFLTIKIIIYELLRLKLSDFYKHTEKLIKRLNNNKISNEILLLYSRKLMNNDNRVRRFVIKRNEITINYTSSDLYNDINFTKDSNGNWFTSYYLEK